MEARSMRFSEVGLLAMEDVTAKPEILEAVNDRAREEKCLISGCEQGTSKRGLCERHYQMFVRTKKSKPRRERRSFEEQKIHEGLILAPGAIRGITSDNPFANV